ncbi:MAG: AbrB/MazE/SpoVT family DNA-binding domain-containing protein [Candidatus Levybacteria bacterium]|nr:AbrB/MazE/SpoVT family DNA-binding domain-containing protein [Candidatus Levybacteria bacterium]
MEMEVKIIQIGNSVGFIIPKLILKVFGWKVGDKVTVKYNSTDGSVLYRKK